MRVLLRVAYDGRRYAGWQIQPDHMTVQEAVEDALHDLFPKQEDLNLIGGSRTDAGVHSYGNPVVFDVDTRMAAERIAPALNARLPEDIRVISSVEVAADFHPHHVESKKTYEYRIMNARVVMPTDGPYFYGVHVPLDVEKMREAAAYLLGEHDFTSFSSVHAQVKSRVRTIYELSVTEDHVDRPGRDLVPGARLQEERRITIRVTGNGFLYNMVRIIAGTLIEVGRGKMTPEAVRDALAGMDRELAGPTAPPEGLFLIGTEFLQVEKPDEKKAEK